MTTKAEPRDHKFVVIDGQAMTRIEAEARTLEVLRTFGVRDSKSALAKKGLTYTPGDKAPVQLSFQSLVEKTRTDGVVPYLERDLYIRTSGHIGMSMASDAAGLGGFTITSGVRTSPEAKMPGYVTNDVVSDILADVLHYRGEAARTSTLVADSYRTCFRAYRAYLSCCVSAIDAFLNRRAWFAINDPKFAWTSAELNDLKKQRMPLSNKVDKWLPTLTKQTLSKTCAEWLAFDQLRELRNGFVHVNEPDYIFSLRDVADALNLCRQGVGGLLSTFATMFGENPSEAISRVWHAPLAKFAQMPTA